MPEDSTLNINSNDLSEFITSTQELFHSQAKERNNELIIKVNEDYPYIYTRDLAILINFLVEENEMDLASKAITFLLNCQLENGEWVQRYNENHERKEDKLQEDNTGLAIWATMKYVNIFDEKKLPELWSSKIKSGVNWLIDNINSNLNLLYSHSSNHEDGINEGYELWTNSVTAKALEYFGAYFDNDNILKQHKKIKKAILNKLVVNNRFARKIDKNGDIHRGADIILLSPYYFDLLPADNHLLKNSAKFIDEQLYDENIGGYWRYNEDVYFPGPWIIYSAILSRYYFDIGQERKGEKILEWIFTHSKNGELPEHLVSRENFYNHMDAQIERAKDMPIEKMKNVRLNIIKELKNKLENQTVVGYSRPIMWSHIETARALKTGNYIEGINFRKGN